MEARTLAVTLAVLAVLALLGYGLISEGDEAVAVGDSAPSLELEQLDGGGPASLDDHRGSWTLLNLWSSWCDPCRAESPALERFSREHHGRVAVVGIDIQDARDEALAFVEEFGLTYRQLRATDSEAVIDDYGMVARPENFLLTPDGELALICRGPLSERTLEGVVDPVIAGRDPDVESFCQVR